MSERRIPCPGCATRKRLSIDNERWRPCEMCGSVRDGTIPDRRAPSAAEDALRAEVAAANERAGRLEEERGQLREAWSIINSEAIDEYAETLTHIVAARAMLNAALVEVPDAL